MEWQGRRACFYIVTVDDGFAPNPDHGVCTLAVCTPNHQRSTLTAGDYIAGCFRSGLPPRIVYTMKVDQVLTLDGYRKDTRFRAKKPTKQYPDGDNVYFKDKDGQYRQDPNARYHRDAKHRQQDTHGDRVFIGKDFVYFGRNAVALPKQFVQCLPATQGIKYLREDEQPQLFAEFLKWRLELGGGKRGTPRDAQPMGAGECERCGNRRSQNSTVRAEVGEREVVAHRSRRGETCS